MWERVTAVRKAGSSKGPCCCRLLNTSAPLLARSARKGVLLCLYEPHRPAGEATAAAVAPGHDSFPQQTLPGTAAAAHRRTFHFLPRPLL